eukprot:13183813-Alexandrium_andersonii.AAC.1
MQIFLEIVRPVALKHFAKSKQVPEWVSEAKARRKQLLASRARIRDTAYKGTKMEEQERDEDIQLK